MILVEVFTRAGCGLCETLIKQVQRVQESLTLDEHFELRLIDIDEDEGLRERYGLEVPVVHVDGHRAFKYRLDSEDFRARVLRASALRAQAGKNP